MSNKPRERAISGLYYFLTVSGDLIILNFLWLICSIPIITIGPATCALYKVCLKVVEDKNYKVISNYFRAFKDNFKQSLVVGLFTLFEIVVLFADYMYITSVEGIVQKVFIVVTIVTLAIVLIANTYLYALIARYENTLKAHIINAFKLAFINPIYTLIIWIVMILPVIVFIYVDINVLLYILWFFILFMFSLPAYINSCLISKTFKVFDSRS